MVGYGGKDLKKRKVLSLEWKSEGVMDDESGEVSVNSPGYPCPAQSAVCLLFARQVQTCIWPS